MHLPILHAASASVKVSRSSKGICRTPRLVYRADTRGPRDGDCIQPLPVGSLPVGVSQGVLEHPRNTWDDPTSLEVEAVAGGRRRRSPATHELDEPNPTHLVPSYFTSDPLRLRTGAMLTLKCFFTILRMLYTYKLSS
jgi:hypothetical protein